MSGARQGRSSWWAAPAVEVGVEIAPDHVAAVAIARAGDGLAVARHAVEPLPPGVIRPSLTAVNIQDAPAVSAAVSGVFERLGRRPKRVALAIPDSSAKVSLVRFEKVPPRADDLEQLVRWQVRKTAPFRIEEAQVTFTPGAEVPDGGREFVVVLTRRDVVEEYEKACADAGAHAGIVDLASFNLINAVLAGARRPRTGEGLPPVVAGDWLLVHVAREYATIAVVRGAHLIFFRNRAAEEEGSLADLVHQTTMYYEDRLAGSGFTRVILAGSGAVGGPPAGEGAALRRSLEERLGTRVEPLDLAAAAAFQDRVGVSPDLADALAPSVGVVLREMVA